MWRSPAATALALIFALFPAIARASGADAAVLEYRHKAGFLLNFLSFVQWPGTDTPDANGPYVIGVAGPDRTFAVLAETLASATAHGRAIVIRRIVGEEGVRACHMVFVTRAEQARSAGLLRASGSAPVLTVGEFEGFAQRGGMINLLVKGGTVRMELNLAATQGAGLQISSKLASLATRVTTAAPAERAKTP